MNNIQEVKCPNCGNIIEFDTNKVPTNVKFDYVCSKCGMRHYIKLQNLSNDTRNENNIYSILNELQKQQKWQEIVDCVDANIENYRQEREKDGVKLYQFPNIFDFFYYVLTHQSERCQWIKNDEFNLINRKMYAMIELKQFREAEKLIDEMLQISPNNAIVKFQYLEIAKLERDLERCEKILEEIHPIIWNYQDYCRLLHAYAWIAIEKEDVDSAVHYLARSLQYDNSENSFNYANSELEYIKRKFNMQTINRPTNAELNEYFKNNPVQHPTPQNIQFAYSLYDYCLRNKDKLQPETISQAKRNLIMINQNYPIAAKTVEVAVLTPNKLITNCNYGFMFEVPKVYKEKEIDKKAHPNRIYEFTNDKNQTILIQFSANFNSDEKYGKSIDEFRAKHVKEGFEIIDEEFFLGQNLIKATKLYEKSQKGNLFVVYWFKFNKNTIGRISAQVKENHSAVEGDIIEIINSWQAL